ncbi:DUF4282 domain-containing protein [Candidatus Saccharibacteria bacterium]|nr:DUF4282 domain-containing protein [Candidatus Saccharibacteria bacterium]
MFLLENKSATNSAGGGYGSSFSGGIVGSSGGIQPAVLLTVGAIALITAIVVFFFVVQRKKSFKGRFANWIKEFLNFRSILVAGIIKVLYIFFAVFLTIMSFIIMFQGKDDEVLPMILTGLASLIIGNILLRVMLELTMALIVVWENTSDIRLLLVKRDELFKGDDNSSQKKEEIINKEQPETGEPIIETPAEKERSIAVQQPENTQPDSSQQQQTPETPSAPIVQ